MKRSVITALPGLCRWGLVTGVDGTSAAKREAMVARMNAMGLVAPEEATREIERHISEAVANAGPLHRIRAIEEHGERARTTMRQYASKGEPPPLGHAAAAGIDLTEEST